MWLPSMNLEHSPISLSDWFYFMSSNPFPPGGLSILMHWIKSTRDIIMISHFGEGFFFPPPFWDWNSTKSEYETGNLNMIILRQCSLITANLHKCDINQSHVLFFWGGRPQLVFEQQMVRVDIIKGWFLRGCPYHCHPAKKKDKKNITFIFMSVEGGIYSMNGQNCHLAIKRHCRKQVWDCLKKFLNLPFYDNVFPFFL